MATEIHPTAIIEKGAELDAGVTIGPYAFIGPAVCLGKGTQVMHHATVDGATTIGEGNEVHPYAYVGGRTHDLKYEGGTPGLRIGSKNVFREFSTIHCATSEATETVLGDHNLILAYSHIAHECLVGSHLIMSSHAALGGHVELGDHVNIGWGVGIHQFCRLGDYAMAGAASKVVKDVPPYMIADGSPAMVRTVNKVGLERAGLSDDAIALIRRLYRTFYKEGLNRSQATEKIRSGEDSAHPLTQTFLEFVEQSRRGIS